MTILRPLTSCQNDDCAAEVSKELSELRIFADRPICDDCYVEGAYGKDPWDTLPPALAIDYEGLEGLAGFLGAILRLFRDCDHMDIDGSDFQDLLDKYGLTTQEIMTKEEADEEWAQDCGFCPGDTFWKYTPVMLTLMRRPA